MKPESIVRVLPWLGRLMLLAGVAMVSYVAYASVRGVVYVASRSTEATIHFDQSPLAFLIGIALYLAGGILFLWIARVLLSRKKSAG
ncbi:MAG: hypothetical protein HS106_16950 [Ideonella sp.]|nr:MAG: hypothetical protein F9K36_04780 [Burkholderiaceae bacterium]MBE7427686.1 hypothetical protein [Ideonella sp.]